MTLGQEFRGYAECVRRGADDVLHASQQLRELNLGATAVGTGLNAGAGLRGPRGSGRQPPQWVPAPSSERLLPRDAEHG